jgi:hypothetical protein
LESLAEIGHMAEAPIGSAIYELHYTLTGHVIAFGRTRKTSTAKTRDIRGIEKE